MLDAKEHDTVALFVDFEHLQKSLEHLFASQCSVTEIIQSLVAQVHDLGVVVLANVYADWEEFPGMQSEMKRLQLDPRFVLPQARDMEITITRGSCSGITMALDALQTMYERSEIDTFVLVTGEPGFFDLVTRLKGHGKNVIVFGCEDTTSADLSETATRFIPLDDSITAEPVNREDTPPSPEDMDFNHPTTGFDWNPFLLLMDRLEQHLPFVSLKYLKNQVLTPVHGCDNSQESKASLIREAIRMKFIETYKIPNPKNPNFATTACRLNRKNQTVRRIVSQARQAL